MFFTSYYVKIYHSHFIMQRNLNLDDEPGSRNMTEDPLSSRSIIVSDAPASTISGGIR